MERAHPGDGRVRAGVVIPPAPSATAELAAAVGSLYLAMAHRLSAAMEAVHRW